MTAHRRESSEKRGLEGGVVGCCMNMLRGDPAAQMKARISVNVVRCSMKVMCCGCTVVFVSTDLDPGRLEARMTFGSGVIDMCFG
jgi:hypothetical protein